MPQIGYKTDIVTYERGERFAGESKYPLKKMISFAIQGITSFSVKPMNFIMSLGIVITVLSVIACIVCGVMTGMGVDLAFKLLLFFGIWLIGGLNIMAVGVVGAYIGKI